MREFENLKIKHAFIITITLLSFLACTQKIDLDKEKEAMKQADIDFSSYSIENGVNKAFTKFAHKEAVILRQNSMPVEGIEQLKQLFKGDDSGLQLSWKPVFASISKSGDLGYTYGTFDRHLKKDDTHVYGTYVSIWKKNEIGEWKWVLDTGNEGLKLNK